MTVGKACERCDEGKVDIPVLIGMLVGLVIIGVVIVTGIYKTLADYGVVTDLRLLLGTLVDPEWRSQWGS
jgi:hypothetical protein